MPKKHTSKRGAKGDDQPEENVDKIRDILFGTQMRDYDQRLEAMEQRLAKNIERSSRDIDRRVERLDALVRREVDKLGEQIKAERKDRTSDAKKGAGELKQFVEQIEGWFTEVDDQIAVESKELRDAVSQQSKDLTAEINDNRDQLRDTLEQQIADLADAKLAREDMATLLSEVATRLGKKPGQPKG